MHELEGNDQLGQKITQFKMPASATTIPPEIQTLRRQYFSLYPPSQLSLPNPSASLLAKHQSYLISHLLEDKYPQPEEGYQRKFWKVLVGRLEEELAGESAQREELVSGFSLM